MSCTVTERLTRYMEQVGKDDFFPIIIRWKHGEFSRDLATKGKVKALAASPGIRSIGLEETNLEHQRKADGGHGRHGDRHGRH